MKKVISASITKTLITGFVVSTVFAANSAQALNPAIQGFSGGSNFPAFNGTDQTIGWSFVANDDLSVTALGFYDQTPATDLSQSHLVGLWTADGNLLASTTIQTNSVLTGSFRYEDIALVNLLAGTSYVIGAAITSPYSDVYTVPGSVTTASEITLINSARNGSSQGFSFPSTLTSGNGRIGPNFQFTTTAAVPFDIPGGAAIPVFGSLFALTLMRKVKKGGFKSVKIVS
jgi:Domain of unknown function (DUF4082)